MVSFKDLRGFGKVGYFVWWSWPTVFFLTLFASYAAAETCLAPQPPFVPADLRAAQEYSDIIRKDFELYIRDIEQYFRCLDDERARAFEEAREVSAAYGRFLKLVEP